MNSVPVGTNLDLPEQQLEPICQGYVAHYKLLKVNREARGDQKVGRAGQAERRLKRELADKEGLL